MGKYLLSSRNLFPRFLGTTVLLLLIYVQPLYSDLNEDEGRLEPRPILEFDEHEGKHQPRPILELDDHEVRALQDVLRGLNQQPLLKTDQIKSICYEKSSGTIYCNCRVHEPKMVCDPDPYWGTISCRNHTTCHVRSIYLSGLQLDGEIKSSIQNLTHLEDLKLSSNYLKGTIPKQLGSLTKLKTLILFRNYLTGSIPKELGNMRNLQHLDVGANKLSGEIPGELGYITSLRHLILTSNQLEGKIPAKLGNLVNLKTLTLADNAFKGTFPKFNKLIRMEDFNVMGNNFSGPLPDYIWKWKKLLRFNLLGNNFEGPIKAISNLTNLVILMISDLKDTQKGFSFPNISELKSLETLILRKCSIVGEINKDIGNLLSLRNIDLSFNRLTGALPKNINQLQLDSIYLTGNKFSGSIPNWKRLKDMKADFSHNNFSNVSFKYFENMSSYLNLYACCNPATANLDVEWGKSTFTCPANTSPSKNTRLFINCGGNETKVNGDIYEADLLKSGGSTIYVSKNDTWAYSSTGKFLGSGGGLKSDYVQRASCLDLDDSPLYTTARISPMSLKYYGLCLKNDKYIVNLHFNEIVFTNYSDYGVNAKRVFDVFIQDELVWKNFDIKKEAKGTRKPLVRTFHTLVKNNGLKIHFYWAGNGSIYIPPGLYGPLVSAISVTPVPRPSKKLTAGQIVGIAGSTFFVMVLILAFLQKMGWLGKIFSNSDSMALVGPYNFQQLKEATNNFSPDNKIGEGVFGRVYRGCDCKGEIIAVKQLLSNSKEQKKGFLTEVVMVSGLNHPNLVKLLGCCWDHQNNQFLIVYEFMENNSLSRALFGTGNLKSRLDWQTRFEICLGIAKGLAFLHEEADEKIIHSDIKPTNILLDKDLKAKISDFGLAKHHEEEHAHVIKVGGTSCYIAPEYAMHGRLTHKADVYSFGVVMLEILSGKASTDNRLNDETVYLLDLAYVLDQDGKLLDLMDPDLKLNYDDLKQANRLLNLAMQCSHPTPAVRPKMSEVVDALEGKTTPKSFPVAAPYSDVGLRKASASGELSRSTHAGSTSRDGTSDSFLSNSTSKEGNFDTPLPTSLQSISDENANTAKNKAE